MYFLRTTPAGKGINPAKGDDNEVLFGEISDKAVPALNTLINNIYKPLVDKMAVEDWKVCEPEQKREFMATFEKFSKDIAEALKSLETNISLDAYPDRHREEAKMMGKKTPSPDMINDFENIFNRWSEKIEQTLEEADNSSTKDKEAGPMVELEYWKQRMRKLTCVSEQLRSKNCRTVYDVLASAAASSGDSLGGKPRDKIYLATSKWRSIELKVTEALSEAKDNVKYL